MADKVAVTFGNSMEPGIKASELIRIAPARNIQLGDIVCFKKKGSVVAHRVVWLKGGRIRTKGDNRLFFDEPILSEQVLGKVLVREQNKAGIATRSYFQGIFWSCMFDNRLMRFLGKVKYRYITKKPILRRFIQ